LAPDSVTTRTATSNLIPIYFEHTPEMGGLQKCSIESHQNHAKNTQEASVLTLICEI